MSRQLVRQRPPAEDDLQPKIDEEKRKSQAAAMTTDRAPGIEHERDAYFAGRYAAASKDAARISLNMLVGRRMVEFGVPESLRHCVMKLVHILQDHGIGAALTALRNDRAIDARHQGSIGHLLAALAKPEAGPS